MIRALLIGFFGLVATVCAQNWPQASGPNLNWKIEGPEPPLAWSVVGGKNILWRTTLPEGGRRLYLLLPNKKRARATIMRMAGRPKAQG